MAIERFLLTNNRVLITKPGYAATPSVADEGKIFDSAWDFTGTLLARGVGYDPATPISPGSSQTASSTPWTIAVPLVASARDYLILLGGFGSGQLITYSNGAWSATLQPIRTSGFRPAQNFSYSNGVLSIIRGQVQGSNPVTYIIRDVIYRVYSV